MGQYSLFYGKYGFGMEKCHCSYALLLQVAHACIDNRHGGVIRDVTKVFVLFCVVRCDPFEVRLNKM